MALGLGGQDAGQVGSDHQTGDADVAAEELVGDGDHPHVVAAERRHEGASTSAPYAPVSTPIGASAPRTQGDRAGSSRGPVALGRGTVDPGEEAGLDAGGDIGGTGELGLEGAGHADAVLVLGEPLVRVGLRERKPGLQVVLVGREHHPAAEHRQEGRLPPLDGLDDGAASAAVWGRMFGSVEYRLTPSGTAHIVASVRVLVEHAGEGVVEHDSVVEAGAHHDLTVDLHAVVEQRPQPPQRGGASTVAEHPRAHLGIGGVDGDEQRRQPLGHDPLEVALREPGEGGEVPVQEGQSVVVVLEVEALPHPGRQLVDEAELAVVVTGAHLVEEGGADLDAEQLPLVLLDDHRVLEAPAGDDELEVGFVGEEPVLDDVARDLAVHGHQLIAGQDPRPGSRRVRLDGHHPRQ